MPEPLTDLEHRILEYLIEYLRVNTYQPSIREIGRRFDIKSTKTVSEYLQALARKGWVERDPSRSRGVRLLGVDLRMGGVAADVIAIGTGDGDAAFDPAVFRALRVVTTAPGLSDLGCRTGDLLFVQGLDDAPLDDGDIVAARYGAVVAAGRCVAGADGLRLEGLSSEPLSLLPEPAEGLQVLGRAVGCWRPFPQRSRTETPIAGEAT